MLLCVLKVVAVWVALILIVPVLVGVIVRGFLHDPTIDAFRKDPLFAREVVRHKRANVAVTALLALLVVALLYVLLRVWNVGVVAAALLVISARVPDLMWEIRTGQKAAERRGAMAALTTVLYWAALPLLWFSMC
jgi:hypothetical protein